MKFIKHLFLWAMTFIGMLINAQNPDLEITSGSRGAGNGPVLNSGPFTFFQNTDNPTGTTYSAYNPPLTVTFNISNPQVTSGGGISTVTNSPINFGYLANGSAGFNQIILRHSIAGAPADNNFTASGAPTGTGIASIKSTTPAYTAAESNYGVSINQSVNYLTGQATNGTYYQADLTLTFNRPVNNPILHFAGLGGVAGGGGFTGEYELSSSNTPVTLSLLSTATSLGVIGNKITNTASTINSTGINSGSGSVLVTGNGITTITFKAYIRGDGFASSWGTVNSAEGFTLGVSLLESDLAVTKTVNKFVAVPGTNVTFTLTATNNGASHSTNTKVTDLLPSGYTFVSATPSTGTYNSTTGVWDVGTLNVGASATMTIVATLKSTVTGNYDNGASISGDNGDPDVSNNIASAVVSPDSDGDGLPDWQDLDDDNDGILDTDECTAVGQNFLVDSVLRDGTLSNGTVAAGSWPTENVTNPATAISYTGAIGEPSSTSVMINYVDSSNPNSLVQNYNIPNIAQTANSTSLVSSTFVQFEEFDSGTPSITYTNVYDHLGNQLMTLSDIQFFNTGAWNSTFTSFTLNSSYITITNPTPGTFVVTKTASSPQYVAFRFKSRTAGFISRFNAAYSNLAANDWVTHKFGRTLVCDADGDGIPNTLDLDSDNDGCVDAVEGDENVLPSQLVSAGGLLSVGTGSTASNQNLCNGTTCVNPNGVPTIVNSGGTADIGGDQGQGIGESQNSSVNQCTDSDGDGIPDNIDVDDDNDGILDTEERVCPGSTIFWNSTTTGSLNNSFTSGSITGTVTTTATSNAASGPVYLNGTGALSIDTVVRGGNGSITGNQTIIDFPTPVRISEFNVRSITSANGSSTVTPNFDEIQIVEFYNGTTRVYFDGTLFAQGTGTIYKHPYYSALDATYSATGPYYNKITGVAYPANSTLNTASPAYPGPNPLEANYKFVIDEPITRIVIKQHPNAKQDNIGYRIYGICTGEKDTDGDGIPDYLDLDSDNDGCLDAIEGGASITASQLVTAGGALTVGTGSTASNQNLCAGTTCVSTSGTNIGLPQLATPSDYSNTTGQTIGSSQNAAVNGCVCYNPPTDLASSVPVNHGITVLKRAGTHTGITTANDWPMVRNSAYTALESKTKGFVITRNANPETSIANPVVGMMVFDTDAPGVNGATGCLKIYTGSGAGEGWKCFNTQGCP